MPILKCKTDDPEAELEFELEYQRSLTTEERFEMMFAKSKQIKEMLLQYGHRKPVEVIKRK